MLSFEPRNQNQTPCQFWQDFDFLIVLPVFAKIHSNPFAVATLKSWLAKFLVCAHLTAVVEPLKWWGTFLFIGLMVLGKLVWTISLISWQQFFVRKNWNDFTTSTASLAYQKNRKLDKSRNFYFPKLSNRSIFGKSRKKSGKKCEIFFSFLRNFSRINIPRCYSRQ